MGVKFCRLSALELKYQLFVAANRTFDATPQLFPYLKKNLILCFDPIDVCHLAHFLGMFATSFLPWNGADDLPTIPH